MASVQYEVACHLPSPKTAIDTQPKTGVNSIVENAASFHLSRCEMRVVNRMRQLAKRGKSYMLIVMGNDAGVRMCETTAPEWEPK